MSTSFHDVKQRAQEDSTFFQELLEAAAQGDEATAKITQVIETWFGEEPQQNVPGKIAEKLTQPQWQAFRAAGERDQMIYFW